MLNDNRHINYKHKLVLMSVYEYIYIENLAIQDLVTDKKNKYAKKTTIATKTICK